MLMMIVNFWIASEDPSKVISERFEKKNMENLKEIKSHVTKMISFC